MNDLKVEKCSIGDFDTDCKLPDPKDVEFFYVTGIMNPVIVATAVGCNAEKLERVLKYSGGKSQHHCKKCRTDDSAQICIRNKFSRSQGHEIENTAGIKMSELAFA